MNEEELITLNQLKEYDLARADNMVKKHTTTGHIDENLIFRATQHTFDYSKSAFDGLFYEVTSFMESSQIPEGAKLIYNDNGTLKFTTSLPPYSGLQFGSPESVAANKEWFDGIEWMPETVALADFTYSTPVMTVKNADGETREVATRAEQSFADHKGDAVDNLLDRKVAENASGIISERTRAQGVESTLQSNIDAERTRAQGVESTLQSSIDAERTRAQGVESTLQSNIDAERTRAQGVESTLQSNIDAERTRAQGVESTKQDNLVSGTNIKTVNGQNILGSGNLHIDTIPTGGTKGQVLTSKGDGTTGWENPSQSFILPVGMVIELRSDLDPNNLLFGTWFRY